MKVAVAIVGGGAAGSASVATLAPQVPVALVDRAEMPGWRIGETLPGAARRPLVAIGAWEAFAAAGHEDAPLKASRWGSEEKQLLDAFRDPDGVGWRLERSRFERDLRSNAVRRGAHLMAGRSVSRIERGSAGWHLELDSGEMIEAALVIDASGRRSRLLEGFGQRRTALDRLACAYQRVPLIGPGDPSTYTQSTRDGWWYSAVLPGGERLIAFHSDADLGAFRAVREAGPLEVAANTPGLAGVVADCDFGVAGAVETCSAASAAGSAAGKGWFAAGDAATALDPLSSQGLFNALVTGIEAGEAALSLLRGHATAPHRYAARIAAIWQAYLEHRAIYYGMEARWRDAPFWQRRLIRQPVAA